MTQSTLDTSKQTIPAKGWETTDTKNVSHGTRRELSDDGEFDSVALQVLLLLDSLSIGQVKAVLRRAERLAGSVATFSIDSPIFREYQRAVQVLLDGDRESL